MTRYRNVLVLLAGIAWAQSSGLVAVISRPISHTVELPGEFQAFQSVQIHTRCADT